MTQTEADNVDLRIDTINVKTERIRALLDRYYNSAVRICPMRSHLATLSWKETEGQPVHIRRARLFEKICDGIPIAIFDGELIAGAQTAYPRGVGLQLDFSPQVGFEIEEGDRRLRAEQTEGFLDDADLQTVIEDSHYWQDKAPGEIMLRQIRENMGPIFEDISVGLCTRSYGSNSISSPDADFAKVLASTPSASAIGLQSRNTAPKVGLPWVMITRPGLPSATSMSSGRVPMPTC